MRDVRRRHEELGLRVEEAAFYDAFAGGADDARADPELAKIAHELVEGIRTELAVDWADREATEAKVRTRIKRLLRNHRYRPQGAVSGGNGIDQTAQLIHKQARALYRRWPDTDFGDQLFI